MYCPNCARKINQVKICPRCGKSVEIRNEIYQLPVGTMLAGRYYIGRVLGQGGFGITYIGVDTNLNKRIAVKEYFPQGIVSRTSNVSRMLTVTAGGKSEIYLHEKQRFVREAEILAEFSENPNVVQVSHVFEENNSAYIVMEYIDGTTLGNYWAQTGSRSFDDLFRLIEPVMAALEDVNARGLVHRDISPANIMVVSRTGALKLLDFGAASEYDDGEVSRSVILKPGFAPLEQYSRHGNQGPWSDVYGLCATMYYLLTGVTPQNAIERAATDTMVHPIRLGADISREEDAVLMCGMAVRAEQRPSSMQELRTAFRLAMEGKLIQKAGAFSETAGRSLKSTVLDRSQGGSGSIPAGGGGSGQPAGRWSHAVWIVLLLLAVTAAAAIAGISRQRQPEKEDTSAVRRITEVLSSAEEEAAGFPAAEEAAAESVDDTSGTAEEWTELTGAEESDAAPELRAVPAQEGAEPSAEEETAAETADEEAGTAEEEPEPSAAEGITAETEKKMSGALEEWAGLLGEAELSDAAKEAPVPERAEEETPAEEATPEPEEKPAEKEQEVSEEAPEEEEENKETEERPAEEASRKEKAAVPFSAALASTAVDLYTETELLVCADGEPLTPEDGEVVITPSSEGSIKVRESEDGWHIKGWIPGTVRITVQKGNRSASVSLTTKTVVPDVEIGSAALVMGESTKAKVLAGEVPVVTNAKGLTIDVGNNKVLGIVRNGRDMTVKALAPGKTELIVTLYGEERRIPVTVSRYGPERVLGSDEDGDPLYAIASFGEIPEKVLNTMVSRASDAVEASTADWESTTYAKDVTYVGSYFLTLKEDLLPEAGKQEKNRLYLVFRVDCVSELEDDGDSVYAEDPYLTAVYYSDIAIGDDGVCVVDPASYTKLTNRYSMPIGDTGEKVSVIGYADLTKLRVGTVTRFLEDYSCADKIDAAAADVASRRVCERISNSSSSYLGSRQRVHSDSTWNTSGSQDSYYSEYYIADSSRVLLSRSDLSGMSICELQMAVNEIFARHGYIFSSAAIQNYFNACSWYSPSVPASRFNMNSLSSIEKKNIDLLKNEETMSPDFIISYSSNRLVPEYELACLTKENLQTAINEIYARHGYAFTEPSIAAWFNSKSWYQGRVAANNFNESVFNSVERANLELMKEVRENNK